MMPWKLYSDAARTSSPGCSATRASWARSAASSSPTTGSSAGSSSRCPTCFACDGATRYRNGVNWRAIARARARRCCRWCPGFVRAATTPGGDVADPGSFDTLYTYAWFVTFALELRRSTSSLMRGRARALRDLALASLRSQPRMPRIVKCGLIQATHAVQHRRADRDDPRGEHRRSTSRSSSRPAREGVQILCMQEIFTGPYFCAEQTPRWYDATERIPDGPTTRLMQEIAKQHAMVIVVPLYEEESHRRLLQHRRRDRRRRHLPRQVPQEPHPAGRARASGRSSTSSPATSAIRCSRRGTRRSACTSATTATSPRARASSG